MRQISNIWSEIINDSKLNGYSINLNESRIKETASRLEEKVTEHFPADYTDSYNHNSPGDLASLVVLNDVDLPKEEEEEILARVSDLEKPLGFFRYLGDHWKYGETEAIWTMGLPIMAKHFFKQSVILRAQNNPKESEEALNKGLTYLQTIREIQNKYGYLPELFVVKNGTVEPNNNELVWTQGIIIEASAMGIEALLKTSNILH